MPFHYISKQTYIWKRLGNGIPGPFVNKMLMEKRLPDARQMRIRTYHDRSHLSQKDVFAASAHCKLEVVCYNEDDRVYTKVRLKMHSV